MIRQNGQIKQHGYQRGREMIIEVRAAEGGLDAKLLVEDQVKIYAKRASRNYL